MIAELLVFAVGVMLLAKSSELCVRQVSSIAKHYGISEFAAGFILIAVATSLPELMIAVFSTSSNAPAISVGNIFGANIINLLVIFGIAVLFFSKFSIGSKSVMENAHAMLFVTFIAIALLLSGSLGFLEGIALICVFITYCFFAFKRKISAEQPNAGGFAPAKTFLFFAASVAVLLLSANIVVSSTISIAQAFSIPQSLIALTVISFGTTLPELASALNAARMKKYGIVAGDLVGSVIVNSTLVLGVAALSGPLSYNRTLITTSIFFLVIAELLTIGLFSVGKKIDRKTGLTLLSAYALFILTELGFVFFIRP